MWEPGGGVRGSKFAIEVWDVQKVRALRGIDSVGGMGGAVRKAVLAPHNFSDPYGVRSLATDGRAVAAFGDDGFVRVWMVNPELTFQEEGGETAGSGDEAVAYDGGM